MRAWRPGRGRSVSRAAAALLAVVIMATGVGCDVIKRTDDARPEPRRSQAKASNPPAGLPSKFTAGQRLAWAGCSAPSGARGHGYECATMKAPLDYRRPGRDAIDVALIRKRATGAERERIGSLLLNFGGPGVSGVVGLPRFFDQYAPLGERYDLVGFDPRGVGGTIPVTCVARRYEARDACPKGSGKVLPYIGTSQTARDLDLMRYLLGDEELHYFGVSYGTELGGVYAHLFPKNVGRLVLEAPVDPTRDQVAGEVAQVKAVQRAFERFARHCARAYDDCPLGRDPDRKVTALLRELEKTPARTGGKEKLDGTDAAYAVSDYLDRGKEGWRPLAKALDDVMTRGDARALMGAADDHEPGARARTTAPSGDNGTTALVAITCTDSNVRPGYDGRADVMARRIRAASPVFGEAWSNSVYLCYEWPFDGERADPDVSARGARPILVVAGTGDPTTPYEGGGHMAAELGEGVGVLLTVRAEGHGTYPQVRCATRAIDTYLLDGTTPKNGTTCP
ncbi:alpha/beta hydrolase [Streptomyces endophyticus]|uniref:Alpha/beta hydrolase n=1 Tax=Streptomyces endophyticus TaxID=714166 RepID=A0ABU6F4G6_9ACTN|nr:alpha/beta hydrolase [Streptomyces endophyticus]MEB8338885.1 alpha/beta hydrolase [Streptomyces endophyticus]